MRHLEIKLQLPYNWGHIRKIGVYDNHGKRLVKIMQGEHHVLEIDPGVTHIIVKLDIFRSEIAIPENSDRLFLMLFMNFRDIFPYMYIDTLKRKCLTGRFTDSAEFETFSPAFYTASRAKMLKAVIDKPTVILGLLITAGLTFTSVVEQDNPNQHTLFFIGVAGFISLLMILFEKGQLLLYDYKARMAASAASFLLSVVLIKNTYPTGFLFLLFTTVFILRAYTSVHNNRYSSTV